MRLQEIALKKKKIPAIPTAYNPMVKITLAMLSDAILRIESTILESRYASIIKSAINLRIAMTFIMEHYNT